MELIILLGLMFLGWSVWWGAEEIAAAIRHAGERMRPPDGYDVNLHFGDEEEDGEPCCDAPGHCCGRDLPWDAWALLDGVNESAQSQGWRDKYHEWEQEFMRRANSRDEDGDCDE